MDRFLEHSRVFVFGTDEHAKVFLSSADWMPRNFYRRVEVMFPIDSPPLKKRILRDILPDYLKDNVRARELLTDGTYVMKTPAEGETPFRCQHELLNLPSQPTNEIARPPTVIPIPANIDELAGKKKRKRAKAKN